jgi:cytochrome c peroxidase
MAAATFATASAIGSAIPDRSTAVLVLADGANPHPVRLERHSAAPLSAMARLGREVFFDQRLSSSGAVSCASCHSPQHAYGPPNDLAVMNGGARAVPSLMYLDRQPPFSVGPDDAESETGPPPVTVGNRPATAAKSAQNPASSAQNLVPQGGLFWDGRANTLQSQALEPLLNPLEMDGGNVARVAAKLRSSTYAARMTQLFGASVFEQPRLAVAQALFAVARYQLEDPSFHPYSSKYDRWLEGKARLSPAEARGFIAFNDQTRANCAACHLDRPARSGLPPLFTDHQFEALGVPRNFDLDVNHSPAYADLGICGPTRSDMRGVRQYCGMFLTPTLRNVATRHGFFHNGVYRTLQAVLDFYNFRDTRPERIYPHRKNGTIAKFDDLPAPYRGNADTADAPFDRKPGTAPPLNAQAERDIIAFLQTLTDSKR